MGLIIIDGKKIETDGSKCVLEVALENGIYIPHLCHHPNLPENGSCRMCMVEVAGEEEMTPSCMLMPKDGMVITTKSEKLKEHRALALDLLLAGHPEDCSTCPKYGNCELQTLIQYVGGASSDMKRYSRKFAENKENPLIDHDMNRCILCGRCVRACKDLRGVGILDYKKEGKEFYIGTLHGKLLKDENCRFCQACAEVCPTGTIRDRLLMNNKENKPREDVIVPCRAACPAHTDVPRYIRFVKEGKYDEAAAVIREKVPFPETLGRICNHVCELNCKRGDVNEAMSIKEIKRFAATHDTGKYWQNKGKQLPDTGKKVCVIGGGPAGMTAAYYLRKQGHSVTLKEALPSVGGMLSYGIPSYRLPRECVAAEYSWIEKTGVKTEVNAKVDNVVGLKKDYDAVVVAVGAHAGVRLPIPGSDLPQVLLNIDFLRNASLGKETGMGERVVILGGGNVAFDCARTAVRLGAKEVHLACLEDRESMTASEEEILEAQEEGVKIYPARTFEAITGDEKVTGVDFMKVLSFTFDENRRAIIKKEEGSEHHIDADTVIFATGQRPDITEDFGLTLGRGNSIVVSGDSLMTDKEGIFAAGDAVYGTKSVIQAIASGRDAAVAVDLYLGGDGDISEVLAPVEKPDDHIGMIEGFAYERREEPEKLSVDKRKHSFCEFDFGISAENICKEAGRCLQCDLRLNIEAPRLWGDYESVQEV